LEFNVPFQHKHGYIVDEDTQSGTLNKYLKTNKTETMLL